MPSAVSFVNFFCSSYFRGSRLPGIRKTSVNTAPLSPRVVKAWSSLLAIKRVRQVTDWEQYGGAPILGFDRLCIKAHGRSTERAIGNAIVVAQRTATTGLVEAMRAGLGKAGLE